MKKIIYTIVALGLIIPFVQKPVHVDALSCLQKSPSIVTVINHADSQLNNVIFNVGNIAVLDANPQISSLNDYINLHDDYIKGAYSTYTNTLKISDDFDQYAEVYFPVSLKGKVNTGDVVVNVGPYSAEACGGPGSYAVFSSDGDLKFIYFSALSYEKSIPNYKLIPTPIGSTETNTTIKFIAPDDANVVLGVHDEYTLEDGNIIEILSIKNKTDEVWFGAPYFSLLIDVKSKIDMGDGMCTINYSRLIRYGRVGDDVRQAQSCLGLLGYDMGPVDGIYGPKTYRGIRDFQTTQGIKIDGIIGPETISYLNKL